MFNKLGSYIDLYRLSSSSCANLGFLSVKTIDYLSYLIIKLSSFILSFHLA